VPCCHSRGIDAILVTEEEDDVLEDLAELVAAEQLDQLRSYPFPVALSCEVVFLASFQKSNFEHGVQGRGEHRGAAGTLVHPTGIR
jgi:hypothetical protein